MRKRNLRRRHKNYAIRYFDLFLRAKIQFLLLLQPFTDWSNMQSSNPDFFSVHNTFVKFCGAGSPLFIFYISVNKLSILSAIPRLVLSKPYRDV